MATLNFISFSFAVMRENCYGPILRIASVVVLVPIEQHVLGPLTERSYRCEPSLWMGTGGMPQRRCKALFLINRTSDFSMSGNATHRALPHTRSREQHLVFTK